MVISVIRQAFSRMSAVSQDLGEFQSLARKSIIKRVFGKGDDNEIKALNLSDHQGFISFLYYAIYRFFDGKALRNDVLMEYLTVSEFYMFNYMLDLAEPNTIEQIPGTNHASYCFPPPGAALSQSWPVDDLTNLLEKTQLS